MTILNRTRVEVAECTCIGSIGFVRACNGQIPDGATVGPEQRSFEIVACGVQTGNGIAVAVQNAGKGSAATGTETDGSPVQTGDIDVVHQNILAAEVIPDVRKFLGCGNGGVSAGDSGHCQCLGRPQGEHQHPGKQKGSQSFFHKQSPKKSYYLQYSIHGNPLTSQKTYPPDIEKKTKK